MIARDVIRKQRYYTFWGMLFISFKHLAFPFNIFQFEPNCSTMYYNV